MTAADRNSGHRVMITGGAGLIGSHIVDLLVTQPEWQDVREILVLDNFVRGRRENLAYASVRG
ncbi:MAG: hypothetical protein FJ026_03380, partial [Chloroflexi bacterium]|nr:hypothetical protein [Chloroflexota bacterium]